MYGTELYSFAGLGSRTANSGFCRWQNQERTYTPAYINGFYLKLTLPFLTNILQVGNRGKLRLEC
jgi:iron complex outermembrane receptor protein